MPASWKNSSYACQLKIQMNMPASCKYRWECLPVPKTDGDACQLEKQMEMPELFLARKSKENLVFEQLGFEQSEEISVKLVNEWFFLLNPAAPSRVENDPWTL